MEMEIIKTGDGALLRQREQEWGRQKMTMTMRNVGSERDGAAIRQLEIICANCVQLMGDVR